MSFAHPEILFLLVLVPLWALWAYRRSRGEAGGLRFSDVSLVSGLPGTRWTRLRWVPSVLRMMTVALAIIALARPQLQNASHQRIAEGIDIMLVLDISGSMKAQDFMPNRLESAKSIAEEFIRGRISDRIGLVIFAGRAYTQVPLTLDYNLLIHMLRGVKMGVVEDGTAIGTAIATAVNRLKSSEASSKVILLLTDGENNRGEIDPITASDLATTHGIRIYTIGMGAEGTAPFPVDHSVFGQRTVEVPVQIDERMMTLVAEKTGGQYFRATNHQALRQIYQDVGSMEQTRVEEHTYVAYQERFAVFLLPALVLLLVEILLSTTRLRTIP